MIVVSAVTALKGKEKKKDKNDGNFEEASEAATKEGDATGPPLPGVAFWIGFCCPTTKISQLQSRIMMEFQACGFSVFTCNVSVCMKFSFLVMVLLFRTTCRKLVGIASYLSNTYLFNTTKTQ